MKTELHELRLPNRTVRCPVELRARRIVLRPRFGDYDGAVFGEGDPVFEWLTTIVEQYRHDPRPLYFDFNPSEQNPTQPNERKNQ